MTSFKLAWLVSFMTLAWPLETAREIDLRAYGVKIKVTDMDEAIRFYTRTLGFKIQSDKYHPEMVTLDTQPWPTILERTSKTNKNNYPNEARTGLSLQTNHLLPTIEGLKARGIKFYDTLLQRNGVGISIPLEDPFGNVLHLLEVQIRDVPRFEEPRIYNFGITSGNMEAATAFYQGVLGFEDWSRKYLPAALPLKHPDGSFAFMLHYQEGVSSKESSHPEEAQIVLLFSANNLEQVRRKIKASEAEIITRSKVPGPLGAYITVKDPLGNVIEIIESDTN